MAKDFEVQGPYGVPYELTGAKIKRIRAEHVKGFWEGNALDVAKKQGIYVFCMKAAKGYRPVYVGKATKSFKQEIFQPHKLNRYAQEFADGSKGTPCFFFIAPGGAQKKVSSSLCDEVETFFIQLAVQKNPNLANDKKTKLADWTIKGLVRSSVKKPPANAAAFRKMIGL
jgi:hypothetical protein